MAGGLWAASHVPGQGWSEPEQLGTEDDNSDLVLDANERVQSIFTDGAEVLTRRFSHEAGWEEALTVYRADEAEDAVNGFPKISFAADGSAFPPG